MTVRALKEKLRGSGGQCVIGRTSDNKFSRYCIIIGGKYSRFYSLRPSFLSDFAVQASSICPVEDSDK
ncbi:hypothetical protein KSP40_PGU013917 [Platanthera guangdongensis]|uniref:Uncharacterized protein n=1 Tax=Platanthera guangdongensis TaxID=2320717 RepID=A0ABR2MS86_9ASPA